ncbi:MAG: glucoamylase family protein [Candidatus Binatia bacterium]
MKRSSAAEPTNDALLDDLRRQTFGYFLHEVNPANGLVADSTQEGSPSSIAAVGFALALYPIGVKHGLMTRDEAIQRTLTTLRFFRNSSHGTARDATGYKGFYYHFLDMRTGRRTWRSELSTIDTTFLLAGMLTAAEYFDADTASEREIGTLAGELYRRADWQWALDGGDTVSHGWTPETGFIKYRWQGYSEALLLYVLGLGSPTHPLPARSYAAWSSTYQWRKLYGHEFLYAGPLFIHQFSHLWVDFRGIQDAFMRAHEIDYFENSRRATYVQQAYGRRNPRRFAGYGEDCWGLTASHGPGPATRRIHGVERRFRDYVARGVPHGPDDGTIAPWAALASLPFAPEIVLPALRHFDQLGLKVSDPYGFKATFNETFPLKNDRIGWVSPWHLGINQGPIIMMIENYQTGWLWTLMRRCEPLVTGLRRAGFLNGWL